MNDDEYHQQQLERQQLWEAARKSQKELDELREELKDERTK